jgi:DNA-binding transcriptional MerR regulator
MTGFALARPNRLGLNAFARQLGLHPQLVRRYVALGLLDAHRGPGGELWFRPAELARAGRVQRLHAGLPLNYAAIGLVLDLLDRIEELQTTLRKGGRGWTSTG